MTYNERAKELRVGDLDNVPSEHILNSQNQTQNKPQLSLQFKGGVARLILSTSDEG